MKLRALATVFCLFVVFAYAETFREPDTGLLFPDQLGIWKRGEVKTFPQTELGVSIGYNLEGGHALTLYVYSKGHTSVPSGGESALIAGEMNEVVTTIESAWKERGSTVRPLIVAHQLKDSAIPGVFALVSVHEFSRSPQKLISISGLTGYRNRILKLRYSYPGGTMEDGLKATSNFLRELIKENANALDPFFEEVVRENYPELKNKTTKPL